MKYAAILIAITILVLAGCSGGQQNSTSSETTSDEKANAGDAANTQLTTDGELRTVTISTSSGEEVEVRVEIADDNAERSKGLMHRTSLGEERGMLFVFNQEAILSFWMKNTLIPLSVAYIDSEGVIVDIQRMEPLDDEPPNYTSAEPAQYALEVNQGFFEERGIEVGDTAQLPT